MNALFGRYLEPPALRFSYSTAGARDHNARAGLMRYGPFDSAVLGKDSVRVGFLYPADKEKAKEVLLAGLRDGLDGFGGFQRMFRVPLDVMQDMPLKEETEEEVRHAIQELMPRADLDVLFLILSEASSPIYRTAKRELLGNGLPSQMVIASKLEGPGLRWTIENIALATYAKAGGTPWVVASESPRRELIIGISRAEDPVQGFVVGFVTLFTRDGDFLLLHSGAPVFAWERGRYVSGLASLIQQAYEEYCRKDGPPERLVIHLCKPPGRFREIEAVEQALRTIGGELPCALVHLNDHSSFRLFDAGHPTYVPAAGLKVDLGTREALLLLDGLVEGRRNRRGVPRVLDIVMDRRSTLQSSELDGLVCQVFNFARINWRGFNARAVPVTLNYSYLISRLIVEIGTETWSNVVASGRLRDKAWFL